MALTFIDQDAHYNEGTDRLRIFALDGSQSVMFAIHREVLDDLEKVERVPVAELQAAYQKHKARIQEAAERVYNIRGSDESLSGAIQIGSQHLSR
jgi:hypothetical protein